MYCLPVEIQDYIHKLAVRQQKSEVCHELRELAVRVRVYEEECLASSYQEILIDGNLHIDIPGGLFICDFHWYSNLKPSWCKYRQYWSPLTEGIDWEVTYKALFREPPDCVIPVFDASRRNIIQRPFLEANFEEGNPWNHALQYNSFDIDLHVAAPGG